MNQKIDSPIYIGDITFDALDPPQLAEFWAAALHYEIQESEAEFAVAIDPARHRPRCVFQKTTLVKVGKNRLHLDLFAADAEAEVARLIDLGACELRRGEDGDVSWTVMLDPEGNEFCVQKPQY